MDCDTMGVDRCGVKTVAACALNVTLAFASRNPEHWMLHRASLHEGFDLVDGGTARK